MCIKKLFCHGACADFFLKNELDVRSKQQITWLAECYRLTRHACNPAKQKERKKKLLLRSSSVRGCICEPKVLSQIKKETAQTNRRVLRKYTLRHI